MRLRRTGPGGAPLRVVVLDDYLDVARRLGDWDRLGGRILLEVWTEPVADAEALRHGLADANVVCLMRERTPMPAGLIRDLPALRLIVTTGMNNASIDLAAAAERGVPVCGTASLIHPTVELTWGLIVALDRGIVAQELSRRRGGWQTELGRGLRGRRLGVLGLGRNGAEVARIGQAFGMDVVAWSANLTDERAREVGVSRAPFDVLLQTSDVVTIHLRLSDRTRHLVGRRELERMVPDALLINTSRAAIVDVAALVEALADGRLRGAGLDVFDEEPIFPEDPLLALPNVVLTPHLGYVTRDNLELFYRETVEDIAAFLDGRPIRVLNGAA